MTKGLVPRFFALLVSTSVVLAACGGGGGGSSSVPSTTTPTPVATATPVTTASETVTTSTTLPQTATYTTSTYSGSATIPAASTATSLITTFTTTQPSGTPTIQNLARRPAAIGASPIGSLAFVCMTPASSVEIGTYPSFTLTVPSAQASSINFAYVAYYDPTNTAAGWTTIEGPATKAGNVLSFASTSWGEPLQSGKQYCFLIFTLQSALSSFSTPTPTPTPTPVATATSTANPLAFTCPASDTTSAVAQTGSVASSASRRASGLRVSRPTAASSNRLAVVYSASAVNGRLSALALNEQAVGGTLVRSFTFSHTGQIVHVLSVPASQMTAAAASLRTQAGVVSVAPTGGRRYFTSVTTPYWPNDPYFNGFTQAQNAIAGNPSAASPAPSTYHTYPYVETSVVPGQWDMHAIQLEYAFGYSQSGNGSNVVNSNALGSSNVNIAIIDTGEDTTHPELASKIVRQRCYITNPSGVQSASNYETDPLGHGTDVAGIAAENSGNAFGFTGAGGKSSIFAYRVFPTPDDNCANDNSTDNQCGADTTDIAAAIEDAVKSGANVISMSLGGDTCGTGSSFAPNGDSDTTEGAAVADAIKANVIVVAASGNSGGSGVSSPACDSDVIAVGATSLADGQANGSNYSGGSVTAPIEYVPSYSQYGSPNTYQSASSWGIVAPGGDPATAETTATGIVDPLHWIQNIWTSTPFQANSTDTSFEGECDPDYPNGGSSSGTADCRTFIAGTSMATPHVAGVIALILAVSGSTYQSPAAMKQLLCETADQLSTTVIANNQYQGCGRLNAYRAMAMALGDTPLPTPAP
jgi:subtilisin family serine protease